MTVDNSSTIDEFCQFLNKACDDGYEMRLGVSSRGYYYSNVLTKIIKDANIGGELDFMLSKLEKFDVLNYCDLNYFIKIINLLIFWCENNIEFMFLHYSEIQKYDSYWSKQCEINNLLSKAKTSKLDEIDDGDNDNIFYVFTYIYEVKKILEYALNNEMSIIVYSGGH